MYQLDDVDPVRHEIGDAAAAEVPEMTPLIEPLRPERLIGCGAEPPFPIELFERDRRIIAGGCVLIPVGVDERDLAEASGIDDLLAEQEMVPASLLRASLDDLLRGFDDPHHFHAFGERVGNRLLDVDVLAGSDRVERHGLVPVIGCADNDRVDGAVIQDPAIVRHLRGRGSRDLGGLKHPRLVDVAHGNHFIPGELVEQRHQPACAAAGADHANADSVARALGRETSDTGGEHEPRGGGAQERAAGALHVGILL